MKIGIYWCPTEEDAKSLFDVLIKEGYTWTSGMELKDTYWDNYLSETCYYVRPEYKVSYCNKEYYEYQEFKVKAFSKESISYYLARRDNIC